MTDESKAPAAPRSAREVPPQRPTWVRVAVALLVVVVVLSGGAIFALLPLFQEDTSAAFIGFPPGTTWTYLDRTSAQEGQRVVVTVTVAEKGRTTFEERGPGGEVRTFVRYVEKGFLWEASLHAGQVQKPVRLFQVGSTKGKRWNESEDESGFPVRHLGLTEAEVPAGTFRQAIDLRTEQTGTVRDAYFVVGVGLVRVEVIVPADPVKKTPAGLVYVRELVKFQRGR